MPVTSIANLGNENISVYERGQITQKNAIAVTESLLIAFPKVTPAFLKLLRQRLRENDFTDEKMIDAVNHVIDTYTGFDKVPSIGDIISYDRRVECLSQMEMLEKRNKLGVSVSEDYVCVDLSGMPYYVKKKDFDKYKFKKFVPKKVETTFIKEEITDEEREKANKHIKLALERIKGMKNVSN